MVIRNGAFPTIILDSRILRYDGTLPVYSTQRVGLSLVVATSPTVLQFTFSNEILAAEEAGAHDGLNPDNYVFTGTMAIAAQNVTVVSLEPMVVDVTLAEEMTGSASYSVDVSAIYSVIGEPLLVSTADFVGVGTIPEVSDVVVQEDYSLLVTFSTAMKYDLALEDEDNYEFSAGLASQTATRTDPTHVTIVTSEQKTGQNYTLVVTNVKGVRATPISDPPGNQHDFIGVGIAPQLNETAIHVDFWHIYVDFSENMVVLEAEDIDNYAIDPALTITSVEQVTATRYQVEFAEDQTLGAAYTLTVTGVHDLVGNPIDLEHNTAVFEGEGPSPPLLSIYPVNGSIDLPSHTVMRIHAIDPRPAFSGINLSTLNITITFNRITWVVVKNGVFDDGLFAGGFSGDPLDALDGMWIRIRPKHHYWEEGSAYQINANVCDVTGDITYATWYLTFSAKNDEFFEDNPIATTHDAKIMDTVLTRYPYSEQVRQLFLRLCTHSVNPIARARTLLWYAASSGIRPLIAPLVNVGVASGTNLGYRIGVLELQTELARYAEQVNKAFGEMNSFYSDEIMRPVEEHLRSADATQVISAIATLVILAVYA